MHRTHTLDVAVIAAGTVSLLLQDEVVELNTGDAVVMPGIIHAWKAGPEGCVIAGTAYGVEAP
jgi:quercetin dioxygenase-like cupin family protein